MLARSGSVCPRTTQRAFAARSLPRAQGSDAASVPGLCFSVSTHRDFKIRAAFSEDSRILCASSGVSTSRASKPVEFFHSFVIAAQYRGCLCVLSFLHITSLRFACWRALR